ncbi:MAG: ABC transporter permease [Clostridia bacterium]|nr:ABC transporter permease [Clostridia bacterium]MBQ8772129.1 ABC transporter permease [Clostridia bacterium]MBQ8873461.1 ABC transporter permease [Clostridia bacterium]MBQ9706997.1 ABC transporter permease [Clostridia bacterium]
MISLISATFPFTYYLEQTLITLKIVGISTLLSYVLGIPLGILLNVTDKNGLYKCRPVNAILGAIINILRSAPFIILLVTLLPAIRKLVGTSVGDVPFTVGLVIAATPFVARMVESSLKEIDYGVVEASLAMGASKMRTIFTVILPEIRSSLIVGATISFATILGYTAMAGTIGAEGLGNTAYTYGYISSNPEVTIICLVLLIVIVQIFQEVGMRIAKKLDHRKKGE